MKSALLALVARVIPTKAWLRTRGYQLSPECSRGQPDTLQHRLTACDGSGVTEELAGQLVQEFYAALVKPDVPPMPEPNLVEHRVGGEIADAADFQWDPGAEVHTNHCFSRVESFVLVLLAMKFYLRFSCTGSCSSAAQTEA